MKQKHAKYTRINNKSTEKFTDEELKLQVTKYTNIFSGGGEDPNLNFRSVWTPMTPSVTLLVSPVMVAPQAWACSKHFIFSEGEGASAPSPSENIKCLLHQQLQQNTQKTNYLCTIFTWGLSSPNPKFAHPWKKSCGCP